MKFSIRDMLLVTVIVALAVGWWVDHREATQGRQALKNQCDQLAEENEIKQYQYRLAIDSMVALEQALDEARPGWRKLDGSYEVEYAPDGVRIPLPNSSAPAPNPPKP
jgi:hypothetical protein